jgi:hypothetical protein
MCLDPLSLITIASAGMSAVGSVMQGNQQNAMAEAQAKAIEQQSQADAQASAFEQQQERRKQDLIAANARAQVGASGVAFAGSPTAVLTANAAQGQLDIEAIQYGSQLRRNNLATQASISRFQGKQAKQAGFINAASGFVSGVSGLFDPSKAVKFGKSAFQ